MKLYFINGSKQRKLLLESDYADDIYDSLIGFFEEHDRFPHILETEMSPEGMRITFESSSESFLVEGASDEEADELKGYIET
ncbi:MAG: hypothetical protein K5669_02560 [Lachnospiraceae bacterium]|nr:hypothetical protein [Lachnospiraceae bacterium]